MRIKATHVHLALTALWAALLVPTITVWHDAIWWIGFISVYANIVSHWGAWQAARAEQKIEEK